MLPGDRTYSTLLVSSSPKFAAVFSPFVTGTRYEKVQVSTSASAARRLLSNRSFDLVILNTPLIDESGIQFAGDIAAKSASVVLVFVPAEKYSEILPALTLQGVYLIPKQTSTQMIQQAMDWLITTRERLRGFEKKEQSLSDKMGEIRLVNRAKWILISEKGFSEDEAHHYIERQAMNQCVTRRVIAEQILRGHE